MTTLSAERVRSGTTISIRDVSLFVDVVGRGHPLVLMHGGPGADHYTMLPFRRSKDRFTLVFYDHRCNGRSTGAPVSSMTWDNLTADADALRQKLGFNKWVVLGHSFVGQGVKHIEVGAIDAHDDGLARARQHLLDPLPRVCLHIVIETGVAVDRL